jgi:methylmalonyl-CoA/ethylmalonyl-CoA epimerase
VEKIEHIGIAVNSVEEAEKLFTALLGKAPYKQERVEKDGVLTSFYQIGESKIELLIATTPESPIRKYLDTKGPGIHHIAFGTSDVQVELDRLAGEGFQLIDKAPRPGADGKRVAFLHPKSTGGVLVELCEDDPNA